MVVGHAVPLQSLARFTAGWSTSPSPVALLNVPSEHSDGASAPARHTAPAQQVAHVVAEVPAKVPAPQPSHAVEPAPLA